jgi:hypothetical protein
MASMTNQPDDSSLPVAASTTYCVDCGAALEQGHSVVAVCRVVAVMSKRHGEVEPGWRWHASPVDGATGWFHVRQQGPDARDRLIGGRGFLGPDDIELWLSSNPLIHGFAQTAEVLAESAAFSDPDRIAAEVLRRTQADRERIS